MSKEMKFKGSQTPWILSENFSGNPCVEVKQKTGWEIGKEFVIEEMGQEDFAIYDAALCATSPELLEFAIYMNDFIPRLHEGKALGFEEYEKVIKRIDKLINKALNND